MATAAEPVFQWTRSVAWLRDFLREELAPYPGRSILVARMVVAATIVMLVTMVFRIPYGAYGAVYALTISRENPDATLKAVKTILITFAVAVADVLVGALLFSGDPLLRLVWVIGTLFLTFYVLSALANYTAATRIGYLLVITIPLWDQRITAELKVEDTLWAVAAMSIASIITAVIELIFARLKPWDDLTMSIVERLQWVTALLRSRADGLPDPTSEQQVIRLTTLGTSRLRRDLQRSDYSPQYAEQMGAVVAFTGRLVDIAASLTYFSHPISDEDRKRLLRLSENIDATIDALLNKRIPQLIPTRDEQTATETIPLLREMERTVSLIAEVFAGTQALASFTPSAPAEPRKSLFLPDAFSNPDHLRFGLKGGLAAILCYITYNLVDWPGLSTAMATCLLTALTTIGASRQKQVLRFGGAVVGGVILGMGAQIFILPAIDSITGFTLLFVAVTILAAWFATSGPRLSYFGVQIAVAFYLINLQEFKFQTSLAAARDRTAGVMLGLFAMWLVFDQLWGAPAVVAMQRTFIATLRLLAQLMREPRSSDLRVAIERSYALRETINTNFETLRQQADGVVLEFGSSRGRDLALRAQLLDWQRELRSVFVARVTLLKYRLRLSGFELPEPVEAAQHQFDDTIAAMLENMADRLEGKTGQPVTIPESPLAHLETVVQDCCPAEGPFSAHLRTFLPLSRRIDGFTRSLNQEISSQSAALLRLDPAGAESP